MSDLPVHETVIIPIVEERAELRVREVERGRVRINVAVDEREALAEAVLRQEDIDVERVPVGRTVAEPPPVREEGDVLIVPLVEERLVVRTELVLKEELRITRRQRAESVSVPVRLRSERAEVTRSEGSRPNLTDDDEGNSASG
jgi:stress response protein YsnF